LIKPFNRLTNGLESYSPSIQYLYYCFNSQNQNKYTGSLTTYEYENKKITVL